MRFASLGIALAWIMTTGCTGDGAAAPERLGPVDTADVFVELPPAPVLRGPPHDELPLGAWDWGAPCRVPVHEEISGNRSRIVRSFVVELADDPATDGYVMTFDDVMFDDRVLGEELAAPALFEHLAVLADMRLGPDGRFIEFIDLERVLADAADQAGFSAPDGLAAILVRQPVVTATILDRTIMSWYGYWLDHRRLPLNPVRLETERVRTGPTGSFRSSVDYFASPVHSDGPWGRSDGPGRWFTYVERALDGSSGRIYVNTVADPADRRPNHVVIALDDFSAGGTTALAASDRRVASFDWESAEGCR